MQKGNYLLLLLLSLWGCQWFKDAPSNSAGVSNQIAQGGCKVSGEELRKFLEKDISHSLDCLKTQLKLYAMVDQRENPEFITQEELQTFLSRFLKNGPDQADGISTLFAINEHIYAGSKQAIEVKAIDSIFNLLINVNRLVVPVFEFYRIRERNGSVSVGEYNYLKAKSDESFHLLAKTISDEITPHNATFHELSTKTILDLIGFENNKKLVNDAHHIRHLKRLFLGGDQELFTFSEIKMALNKLPELGPALLDLFMLESITFDTEIQRLRFIESLINSFRRLIYNSNNNKQIYFDIDDVIELSKSMKKLPIDLSKYQSSLIELKRSSIIGGDQNFTYDNIQKIFDHLDHLIGIYIAFTEIWDINEDKLLAPTAIDAKDILIPESDDKHIENFKNLFVKVATSYKYLPKSNGLSVYGRHYIRSRQGMIKVGLYEYLVKEFVMAYGSLEKGNAMMKDDLLNVVMSYQDFVIDLNFWRNPIYKMVNSQFLMGDFFRAHSDGNGRASISEVVGIILMDTGSYHLAKTTYPELQLQAQSAGFDLIQFDELNPYPEKNLGGEIITHPQFTGVSTEFFYKNFIKWVSSFRDSFPLLYKDLLALNDNDRQQYARSMAMFTRHCPFDYLDELEVPIQQKDLVLILGGMISIEETFIRFDTNQNQVLEFDELERVVAHFKPAILDIMSVNGFHAKSEKQATDLSRTIFYYLITHQTLPVNEKGKVDTLKVLGFHLKLKTFMKEKKIKANRPLLAQVLLALAPRESAPRKECFREKVIPD